ncbi:Subtilisin-like protease SBT4.4 [Vitis vinifera]|uniref:Subtilisin-like protease SBT4.4 n=1 Tax=Vitis vinifera TaxID=29760 RepID=A0A438FAF1_VITVI|nr:Subtilisin-like protease SBT4.4 [Vitis vinifera]
MARFNFVGVFSICLLVFATSFKGGAANDQDRKASLVLATYIVYMGALPQQQFSPLSQHLSILEDALGGSSPEDSLVRSYGRSFNGFAAKLTEQEREKLASKEEVVSVFPSGILQLHTTRSWDFMGFPQTVKRVPSIESDIIIGVLDTGIWPESKSFSDEGLGPVQKNGKFLKIIGARVYNSMISPDNTARDSEGHGTHTASTAAGSVVKGASFYGVGKGDARGGVPSARIAVYKVCYETGCTVADVMAAFDDAISDGVDIITVSLGAAAALPLDSDSIGIGAFHAMAKGILTLNSAGNNGPVPVSVSSVAPWMVSVAASTTDRRIIGEVVLGNGVTVEGIAINSFELNGTNHLLYMERPLVHVINKMPKASRVGALGTITLAQEYQEKVPFIVPVPMTTLTRPDFEKVEAYINSTKKPKANILKSESLNDTSAPVVAFFHHEGLTESFTLILLQPDITAPGVDILAAFSPIAPISDADEDDRRVNYNFLSGTSMSCPHAAAVAAYVKSFHPTWSPSAIKSAIMTTAQRLDPSNNPDGELAYGSGHIDPVKARSPGLVYDASKEDYIKMMCTMGYDTNQVRLISGDNSTSCPKDGKGSPRDLNYPSMAAKVDPKKPFAVKFPRTVTNVGFANSTYKAKIRIRSRHIKVQVNPSTLSFKSLNETKSFLVTVTGDGLNFEKDPTASASLAWSDGNHHVRSPIFVYVLKDGF